MRIKHTITLYALLFTLFASSAAHAGPPPTGLAGTALSPTSIQWSWTFVSGATSYNVYDASAPFTLIGSTPSTVFLETSLSTNTFHDRQVTDIIAGVESSTSAPAFACTLAAVPGQPVATNIMSSSVTLTWATRGNPGTTPYQ